MTSVFDHHIYVLASDGDIMEGVTHEASALAAHQELGNLTLIYDQNHISIEDDTNISFSEDVAKRYEAYGWDVHTVDWRRNTADDEGGYRYVEDVDELLAAIEAGKKVTNKPTLVVLKTIIAWPAPTKQNTGKSHGSALGDDEVDATHEMLGFPQKRFPVERSVLSHARKVVGRGKAAHQAWDKRYAAWRKANADKTRAARPGRLRQGARPGWARRCRPSRPTSTRACRPGPPPARCSTRWPTSCRSCGAARPTSPSPTTRRWTASRRSSPRASRRTSGRAGPVGRTLHFGIREFGMGCILNGIALEGLTRPYGGTFLVFSDYMRGAVRLAAVQGIPVTFVWTHDSIGLGEDGPTHQPVEHLAALRAMPGLDVVRPADANETAVCWETILDNAKPAGLVLTRQNLPIYDRKAFAKAANASKGAYVLVDGGKNGKESPTSSSSRPAPR